MAKEKNEQLALRPPRKNEIDGAKQISNWADLILQMYRIPKPLRTGEWSGVDGIINVCKVRESGLEGFITIVVQQESNRVIQHRDLGQDPHFGWMFSNAATNA